MAKYQSLSSDSRVGEMPRSCTWMTHNEPPQITGVVYDKGSSEDHWSGLNPAKIARVIEIEAAVRQGALT